MEMFDYNQLLLVNTIEKSLFALLKVLRVQFTGDGQFYSFPMPRFLLMMYTNIVMVRGNSGN